MFQGLEKTSLEGEPRNARQREVEFTVLYNKCQETVLLRGLRSKNNFTTDVDIHRIIL